jgi:hypothetical protein
MGFCIFQIPMRLLYFFIFLLSFKVVSQETIKTNLLNKLDIEVDQVVNIDPFGTVFTVSNNVLTKKRKSNTFPYNNVSLGEISSVNAFNPLKPNLFYRDFNTAVILDNRLAEIAQVNFNNFSPNRDVSHISTGYDNTIWIFNKLTQQLELFDYKTNKSRITTLPVEGEVLDMASDFNSCWLLTDGFIYHFNYFGSLISKSKNYEYTKLSLVKNGLIFFKENNLYYHEIESDTYIPITLPELLIKQFFVTNETLYIYDGKTLYHYQLIKE